MIKLVYNKGAINNAVRRYKEFKREEDMEYIVANTRNIFYSIVKDYKEIEKEDYNYLYGMCLTNSINNWNGKGTFTSYLYAACTKNIRRERRDSLRKKRHISKDKLVSLDVCKSQFTGESIVEHMMNGDGDLCEDIVIKVMVDNALKTVSCTKSRQAISLFLEGNNVNWCCSVSKISYPTFYKYFDVFKTSIKKELEED